MSDLAILNATMSIDSGNVSVILGLLEGIHGEVSDDEVMVDFAASIRHAIGQLRDLQQLAYETMIEIEMERAAGFTAAASSSGKPH